MKMKNNAKVINIKSKEEYDVFIGRPSKWGNPFTHLPHLGGSLIIVSSRDEAVEKYAEYLQQNSQLIIDAKKELKNKRLGCFCAPLRCHGDILLKIANEEE